MAQTLNLLEAIISPTLVITSPWASEYLGEDLLQKRLSAISNCTHVTNPGHHHFHMEQASPTGKLITEFLQQEDSHDIS